MMYKNIRNGSFKRCVHHRFGACFDQSKHLEQIGHAKYPSWFGCV